MTLSDHRAARRGVAGPFTSTLGLSVDGRWEEPQAKQLGIGREGGLVGLRRDTETRAIGVPD